MGQITDSDFSIPIIFPEVIHKEFQYSQNKPILIEGRNLKDGVNRSYVLKPTGASRMYGDAITKELVASLIAIELGYFTPTPVLISIDSSSLLLFKGLISYETMTKSIGLNFGNLYFEGMPVWNQDDFNKKSLFNQIQSILVFDLFIENPDRTINKPNMLTNGLDILILDHELAFSFTDLIGYKNPTPWKLTQQDLFLLENHIFFSFLKKKKFSSEFYVEKFNKINDNFWYKVEKIIPDNYLHGKYIDIKNYVQNRVSNLEIYCKEMEKVLA
ncbi:MAG: hypothetical protein IPM32_15330 [Ignavibacteriae bacterium]|nr:hypothetical protein [Ignavibacteriota bacterium]